MIKCGKDTSLEESSALPEVSAGIAQFMQNVRVGIVQASQINGLTQEIPVWRQALACIQPMPERLSIAKEGERSWRWFSIFVQSDVMLSTDDVVVILGISYKIMEKVGWDQYGYIEYQAIEWYKKYEA